ncbi:MAG TPA: hypothetical protein VH170_07115 [Chthoniobacterales bacterium]|nr:hypothetical protein [Chthoniobacterales bacterium]
MHPKTKITVSLALGIAWAGATVFGAHALLKYENTAGKVSNVTSNWPSNSSIQLAPDRPTLVMFAHPQCPCTRASVNELASIVAHTQAKARVFVLFYTPQSAPADWATTPLHRAVEQINGVTILPDADGIEAQRFGAETSGHAFLFDRDGRLLFNGGITASRGHAGENVGEDSIVSMINQHSASQTRTLVFGCPFHRQKPTSACLK